MQTIFALSSSRGKSALNVYRLSGKDSLRVANELSNTTTEFIHRKMYRLKLFYPKSTELIDDVMLCYFKAPKSFTGEDCVEIYSHGSIAVDKSLTSAVLSLDYVRLAEKGEFTKRAVLNSKMDLVSAEGLIDLINSETNLQKKQALKQMNGELINDLDIVKSEIIKILSLVEAYIDFPDENIPDAAIRNAEEKIEDFKSKISKYLKGQNRAERLRNGLKMVIYGKPNVGKSSLINYLSKREVSIVSDISGTTRDSIETHLDINGYPVILVDTAGIKEESDDLIEIEGIKRAKKHIYSADIKIFMQTAADEDIIFEDSEDTICVLNKMDVKQIYLKENFVPISIKKFEGLDLLIQKITDLCEKFAGNGEEVAITRVRQRSSLEKSFSALQRVDLKNDLVLASEDLRIAARELSFLFGKVDVEEILDQVFADFCIGK
jgi:tRNA modification GTPase